MATAIPRCRATTSYHSSGSFPSSLALWCPSGFRRSMCAPSVRLLTPWCSRSRAVSSSPRAIRFERITFHLSLARFQGEEVMLVCESMWRVCVCVCVCVCVSLQLTTQTMTFCKHIQNDATHFCHACTSVGLYFNCWVCWSQPRWHELEVICRGCACRNYRQFSTGRL